MGLRRRAHTIVDRRQVVQTSLSLGSREAPQNGQGMVGGLLAMGCDTRPPSLLGGLGLLSAAQGLRGGKPFDPCENAGP